MPGEVRDIRMIQKALEQRWPIEPRHRNVLVQRLVSIIANRESTNREATAAARALIAAEAQNAADEQHGDRMDESRNRILATLARLRAGSSDTVIDSIGTSVVSPSDTDADGREGQ